jgi:hypothetical protein
MDAELRTLTEEFARKAREFSDAVARLGRSPQTQPEKILRMLDDVKLIHRLADEAEERLELYLYRDGNTEPIGTETPNRDRPIQKAGTSPHPKLHQ